MTGRLAVLGRDVSRSLSPLLHAAAIRALGLDLEYGAISCADAASFIRTIDELAVDGAVGANVTIPYKRTAYDLCSVLSTTAKEIGAVNRLTLSRDAAPNGDNTDGPAIVQQLAALPGTALDRVQLLGAGGAARAAAWALRQSGAREVVVCARDTSEGEAVARLAGGRAQALAPVAEATLILSTLPGTHELAACAVRDWIDPRARPWVFDLAYTELQRQTPLVARAVDRGWPAKDGLGMLVEQAALSLAAWTGGDLSQIRRAMHGAVGAAL